MHRAARFEDSIRILRHHVLIRSSRTGMRLLQQGGVGGRVCSTPKNYAAKPHTPGQGLFGARRHGDGRPRGVEAGAAGDPSDPIDAVRALLRCNGFDHPDFHRKIARCTAWPSPRARRRWSSRASLLVAALGPGLVAACGGGDTSSAVGAQRVPRSGPIRFCAVRGSPHLEHAPALGETPFCGPGHMITSNWGARRVKPGPVEMLRETRSTFYFLQTAAWARSRLPVRTPRAAPRRLSTRSRRPRRHTGTSHSANSPSPSRVAGARGGRTECGVL